MVSTNLIDIDEKEAQLYFIPLMLQDGEMKKSLGEMPMVRLGGAEGIRTPDLLPANYTKGLVPTTFEAKLLFYAYLCFSFKTLIFDPCL